MNSTQSVNIDCAGSGDLADKLPVGRLPPRGVTSDVAYSPKNAARDSRAFTLIELMVVIVLIAIISAAILPAMRGTYEDALLRSTARELLDVFQLASSRAVSLNQAQRVRLAEDTGKYQIEAETDSAAGVPEFIPTRDVPGAEGTLDTRIALSVRLGNADPDAGQPGETSLANASATGATSESVLEFYPDGTADAFEIRLQDREGFRLLLKVNPVTARVRVLEVARE